MHKMAVSKEMPLEQNVQERLSKDYIFFSDF
jgi:hypothetical protein